MEVIDGPKAITSHDDSVTPTGATEAEPDPLGEAQGSWTAGAPRGAVEARRRQASGVAVS